MLTIALLSSLAVYLMGVGGGEAGEATRARIASQRASAEAYRLAREELFAEPPTFVVEHIAWQVRAVSLQERARRRSDRASL